MKKITGFVLVLIASVAHAQDCNNYYYLQNNKTVEMSLYDKKGDASGRLVYTISDVKIPVMKPQQLCSHRCLIKKVKP